MGKSTRAIRRQQNSADMKKVWRDPILLTTIIFLIIMLSIFILYPLYSVLKVSFIENGGFSLSAYSQMLKDIDFKESLINTLVLGITVSTLSTIIGFIFAYADAYIKTRFRKLFKVVSILPIVSPPFVLALSAIMLFGQFGLITRHLFGIPDANIYGFKGLVVVQTMTFFPIVYLLLVGLLKKVDPALEEASRSMGATRWKTFKTVTLPLMLPGIANAFLITFIEVLADFSNPMVIGGNFGTLATKVYMQAIGNYDMRGGAAIAVTLLTLSILLFVVEKFWIERKSYVTVTGKASRERDLITEKHIVMPIEIICLMITVFVLAFYILVPLGGLFKVMGIDYTLTLDHFKYVFNLGIEPIKDTTLLAIYATPITGILGMIIAFLVVRKKFYGRNFIEFTSILAMAVPGTVLGLGYISAFNTKPLILTGTAFLIVVAFIVRSLPVGIRGGIAALQQIDPAIEEAAQDLGASANKVFTSVTLPLIKSAFFGGLVYSFVRSMTAVSTVVFLVTPKYQLLTASILSQVDNGRFGVASAFSTVLIVIVLSAIGLMSLLLSKFGVSKSDDSVI
ncbi:iron ABC transporter permease [Clostridium gasigenes]|uniref:ABC transporter permease n=1 Tax=Clostridium gasigenes TaxID=94869 RepID=UPI001C0D295A|nr:iron ABC transporter permease [Clostridium gasigenes]MBU3137831.1 iron ABC transporter permease [Clostridium gasigenes]